MESNKPQRILHMFTSLDRGGAESRTMDLYRTIDRKEIQFDFAVMRDGEHYFTNEINKLGGRIFYLQHPRIVGLLEYQKQLRKVLNIEGPFIAVHSHLSIFSGIVMFCAMMERIPIRIAHSRSAPTKKSEKSNIFYRVYAQIMRVLIHLFATHKVSCGTDAGYYLFGKRAMDKKNVSIIPNAIDLSIYENINDDKYLLRKKYGFNEASFIIGTVGNLNPWKNHAFLIDVFPLIKEKYPNSLLVVIGKGILYNALMDKVVNLNIKDSVLLLGRRNDVPQLLHTFDVFVLPSFYEGVPGVVVEAQAAGIPCVLSDSITRDIDFGNNMVTYLSLDATKQEWANKISYTGHKPLAKKGECLQILRENGYDVVDSAKQIRKIYTRGASKNNGKVQR